VTSALAVAPARSSFLGYDESLIYPPGLPTTWDVISNGWAGKLTFTNSGSSVSGVIQYNNGQITNPSAVPNSVEILDHLQFISHHNGWFVYFHRPGPNQTYWGLIDNQLTKINGQFSHPGYNIAFTFDATVAQASQPYSGSTLPPPPLTLFGGWSILSDGWPGQLTFPNKYHGDGLIQYDNAQLPSGQPNPSEPIINVSFGQHYNQWYVNFYRPQANQWYYGLYDSDLRNIHGHFTSGPSYPVYPFDATRESKVASCEASFGRWSVLSNSWPGGLSITSSTAGSISYDDRSLSTLGVSLLTETLENFTWVIKYGAAYLKFYRPAPNQWYYGLAEIDWQNIHGSFSSGGGIYEFDATRTVLDYSPL